MPPMGSVNLHGSLLPQYRGAAPINWAVINGEKETGCTTFKLQQEIDTGDILLQASFLIGENDTAGDVHDKMKVIGAALLVKTVKDLADDSIREVPQLLNTNNQQSTIQHAPKIFTATCTIDFTKSVAAVHNLVRGLSPFPAAFTNFNGKMLKIYATEKEPCLASEAAAGKLEPGELKTDGKNYLKFACNDGFIHVKELQLEGKKKMLTADFLRGYRFE